MSRLSTVLLIDDDQGIRDLVTLALTDEGYEVLTARNGAEALDLVQASMPALILLDTRMPIMDGHEFASAYGSLPDPRAPVVLLTASTDIETVRDKISDEDVLSKPFDLDDLLNVVERYAGSGLNSADH